MLRKIGEILQTSPLSLQSAVNWIKKTPYALPAILFTLVALIPSLYNPAITILLVIALACFVISLIPGTSLQDRLPSFIRDFLGSSVAPLQRCARYAAFAGVILLAVKTAVGLAITIIAVIVGVALCIDLYQYSNAQQGVNTSPAFNNLSTVADMGIKLFATLTAAITATDNTEPADNTPPNPFQTLAATASGIFSSAIASFQPTGSNTNSSGDSSDSSGDSADDPDCQSNYFNNK